MFYFYGWFFLIPLLNSMSWWVDMAPKKVHGEVRNEV